jgi:glycosyltransferase involved in cell wall biosynthesis
MRIVYILTRADEIGGAQVHVRDLATALHSSGHEVTVLAGSPGSLSEQLSERGVPFEPVPALVRPITVWKDAAAVRQLTSTLRRLSPELVSVHTSKAGWLGRLAAKLAGIPVVFTAHGWAFTEGVPRLQRRLYGWVERLAGPMADQIITVCDYDRALALEKRIAPPHKIVRIHNGVRDPLGPGAMAPQPEPRSVQILMLGRFAAQKDHPILLHALAGLRAEPWRLDLAGSGPDQARVEALAAELGLACRIRFLGHRDEVGRLLRESDMLALISRWEGLPYSILEAMSCGLPVIASDVGGVSEAVIHGETGILVPRGDVDMLRSALAELINDPQRRHRLGIAARRRYETAFRLERMLSETLALYQGVAALSTTTAAREEAL